MIYLVFFSVIVWLIVRKRLSAGTVPVNKKHLTGTTQSIYKGVY